MKNNNNMIFLSHALSEKTPLYGNGSGIKFTSDKKIKNGDSCNTMNLSFPNHSSTHIDFPCHFNQNGKSLNDYPASFWEFNSVELLDLSGDVSDCQIIGPGSIKEIKNPEADLLLIKTGYGEFRGSDRYTITPPGLSSKLAPFLRENFPKLRCLGMDLISISSYSNRVEGRKAHHAFLNPLKSNPILLIEDMKLSNNKIIEKVIISPLQIDKADGSPCTILAYTKNEN